MHYIQKFQKINDDKTKRKKNALDVTHTFGVCLMTFYNHLTIDIAQISEKL